LLPIDDPFPSPIRNARNFGSLGSVLLGFYILLAGHLRKKEKQKKRRILGIIIFYFDEHMNTNSGYKNFDFFLKNNEDCKGFFFLFNLFSRKREG
jgi:hypothetical protein